MTSLISKLTYLSKQAVSSVCPKSQEKNLIILRTKRAFHFWRAITESNKKKFFGRFFLWMALRKDENRKKRISWAVSCIDEWRIFLKIKNVFENKNILQSMNICRKDFLALTKILSPHSYILNIDYCNYTRTQNHLVALVTQNHLVTFRFCACFKEGVAWHSGNYRVWIHSETRTWYDKNIQFNIHSLIADFVSVSLNLVCSTRKSCVTNIFF